MKRAELLDKARALLAPHDALAVRRLGPLVRTLEQSIDPAHSHFNLFEIGLRSGAPDSVQINQIQGYQRRENDLAAQLAARKVDGVMDCARRIGRDAAFSLEMLNRLTGYLRDNGSAYSRVLFSFEFDAARNQFRKMTVYGHIRDQRDIKNLCQLLRISDSPVRKMIQSDFTNIGVDFPTGGSFQLKIYRRLPLADSHFDDLGARPLLDSLRRLLPLRDLATMTRLTAAGGIIEPVKWGVNFQRKTSVADLARIPRLREKFPEFLNRIDRHCADLEISYLAFDNYDFGVYCGKNLESWLEWLKPHA